MLAGGIWTIFWIITHRGSGDNPPLIFYLAFVIAGVYWFAIRPFHFRWMLRRKFTNNPDRNLVIEWQVDEDQLSRSGHWRSAFEWEMFRMILSTPRGVLLYFPTGSFFWLPRHGFVSDAEFERFIALAKGKLHGFYHMA